MLGKIIAWLQQPTSVNGLGVIAAALAGGFSHAVPWPQAMAGLVGGAVLIAIPDNSGERAVINKVVQTFIAGMQAGPQVSVGKALADAVASVPPQTTPPA